MKRLLILAGLLALMLFSFIGVQGQTRVMRGNLKVDGTIFEAGAREIATESPMLYISKTGSDATGDGSSENPYRTTKYAVEQVAGIKYHGNTTPAFFYDTGVWYVDSIFPYLSKVDIETSYYVQVFGTEILEDTINLTHAGTGTASYFRFASDSTITEDLSGKFISRLTFPATGAQYGYPVVENDGNTNIIIPGDQYIAGTDRIIYSLGTKFVCGTSNPLGMKGLRFTSINFTQSGVDATYDFRGSHYVAFNGCKFDGDYECYDLIQLEEVPTSYMYRCHVEFTPKSYTGDIVEFNLGKAVISFTHFETIHGTVESSAIETRPGCAHFEAYMISAKGFREVIKNDGVTVMSLGGMYIDSCTYGIKLFDPRRQFIGQSDYNVWTAGYDSIICVDVDALFDMSDAYDAGKSIFLPQLKAGGYTALFTSGDWYNNTMNLGNMSEIAIGSYGLDVLIVDTLKTVPPHAALAFDDASTTLNMTQNEWAKITNGTDNLFSTKDLAGVTGNGDSLTIIAPGHYVINASLSFSGTSNSDIYEFAIFKNDVLASPKIERTTTSTDIGNVSLPFYMDGLVAGDDLCLKVRNTVNDFDATVIACSWMIWLLHH